MKSIATIYTKYDFYIFIYLIIALLTLKPANLFSQPKSDTLFINGSGEYPVYKHLYIYETDKKVNPHFVYDSVKPSEFIKLNPNKSFDKLTELIRYYWLIVIIKNNLPKDETFYYWLNSPDLSIVKAYQKQETENFKSAGNSGYYIPFELRQVKSHDAEFNFRIKKDESSVIILVIENPDARVIDFLPQLSDASTRRDKQENYYLIMGVIMGIMIIAFLLNIFFAISLKEKIHYLYALYVICLLYEIFNLEGIAENYFGTNDYRLAQMINHAFPCLCSFLMARIMQWFLQQKRSNSHFKILLDFANYLLLFIALMYVADYIIKFSFFFSNLLQIVLLISTGVQLLLIAASAIEKTIQNYKLAWLYLAATTWLFIGWFEFVLMFLGVNNIVELIEGRHPNDLEIGFVIEAVVVFMAIIYRYNLYKKEKENLLTEVNEQQYNLLKRIATAEENERSRIAADLHDDVGSTLSALNLYISNISEKALTSSATEKYYRQTLALSNKAVNDIRDIAHNLLPKDFKKTGLFIILQKRINELNSLVQIRFNLITEGDEERLSEVFSVNIYRIINELLSNIIKHSLASDAAIQLLVEERNVQIMTEDDGVGFVNDMLGDGIGLKNIKRRVEFLKGTIQIDNNNKGTHTIINLPL